MIVRRSLPVVVVGVLALLAWGAVAWACVSGPTTFLSPTSAAPGAEVKVSGVYFTKEEPIEVRLGRLDGPVLATFTPAQGSRSFGLEMEGTIVVPPGTPPGDHVVVFTQRDSAGTLVQTPSRLLLTVTGAGGATPVAGAPVGLGETGREPGLVKTEGSGLSGGAMLLIGLGAAGLGMMVAGMAASAAGRRRHQADPEPATVRR